MPHLLSCFKNSPPILFINSQFDRFHAGRDDMIAELNTFGIYSEIKKIENSPHAFWFSSLGFCQQ
jgi:pectinesterase